MSTVFLEIALHEGDKLYAEWEMWRESFGPDGLPEQPEWITRGTSSSLEAAVDKAVAAWQEARQPDDFPTSGAG